MSPVFSVFFFSLTKVAELTCFIDLRDTYDLD